MTLFNPEYDRLLDELDRVICDPRTSRHIAHYLSSLRALAVQSQRNNDDYAASKDTLINELRARVDGSPHDEIQFYSDWLDELEQ